jgi:hypothetical protein
MRLSISNLSAALNNINPFNKKISQTSSEGVRDEQFDPKKIPDKSDLELMYKTCPEIFSLVNFHAAMASAFEIVTDSDKEAEIIKKFHRSLSKTSSPDAFNELIKKTSVAADVFGIGPIELHSKGDYGFTISIIHPNSMEPKKDGLGNIEINTETGMPKNWVQTTQDGLTKTEIPEESLAFLKYNDFADEIYGTPITQPAYNSGLGKLNTELGFANAITRAGYPTTCFSVGDEKHEPGKEVMDDLRNRVLKDFGTVREFVHEYYINPKIMESYTLPQGRNYVEPFIKSMATAAMLPTSFIGGSMADLKYNSAPMLMEIVSEASINPRRKVVATFITDKILYPLFAANGIEDPKARVVYHPPFPRNKQTMADVVSKLAATQVNGKDVFTADELRELMGFKPLEDVKKTMPTEPEQDLSL